ncbi:MAG: nuclear transport factor 2 family protein [Clostridiales bacterium]|nr:nuclear transport factor 2 family protein [Clostridiales bacterium]
MNDIETVKELYRKYWQYMIDKDEKGLRGLMSDDYYLMHMTGVKQSTDTFLKGLKDGTFNYYSADHDSVEVEVKGDSAGLTGKSRVLAAVYGGGRNYWRLRGDFTLRKENGTWKMTSSRASTY